MNTTENKKLAWFLLILLSVVWGASYILIKFSLHDTEGNERLKPDQLGAIRMVIASIVLLPFFFKYYKNIQRKHIVPILISGICGNGLPAYLFAYAQMTLPSAITGMLNSLVPVFAISISAIIFGFKVKWNHLVGIVLGVFGGYVIMYSKLQGVTLTKDEILPFVLVLIATLCYAISLNVIKYQLQELKPMTITSAAFLSVGLPSLVYLLSTDIVEQVSSQNNIWEGIGLVSLLAIMGTAVAVYLFNHLIKISSPIFASSVTYFIPVVATIFGVIFKETIAMFEIIGMAILVGGVLLINAQFRKKSRVVEKTTL